MQVDRAEHPGARGKHLVHVLELCVLVADLIVQHLLPQDQALQLSTLYMCRETCFFLDSSEKHDLLQTANAIALTDESWHFHAPSQAYFQQPRDHKCSEAGQGWVCHAAQAQSNAPSSQSKREENLI